MRLCLFPLLKKWQKDKIAIITPLKSRHRQQQLHRRKPKKITFEEKKLSTLQSLRVINIWNPQENSEAA